MTWFRKYPEVAFTMSVVVTTAVFSLTLGLPFSLPDAGGSAFIGMHYLYPIIGLGIWAAIAAIGQSNNRTFTFLLALPCYIVVLYCHFNIKLWGPHINPTLWDDLYWRMDQAIYPVVEGCFAVRRAISGVIPLDVDMYLFAFIALFYVSFCYHALKTPQHFRKLFFAALVVQGLGAVAYLIMPALGPFLYEQGVEAFPTRAQAYLLEIHEANVAGGADWLREHGPASLTAGLGAMPSLHSASTFLFVLFARRYAPVLLPVYSLLFGYILIAAVANRWHYIIDIPVGLALAWFAYFVAHHLLPTVPENRADADTVADTESPEPAVA